MIPSFYPVSRYLKGVKKTTTERRDLVSGLEIKKLSELLDTSKVVRYPDLPHFSYSEMLATELNDSTISPFTEDGKPFWANQSGQKRIAVVGGGMSGLLSAWQLSKLGAYVDLYEASAEPNDSEQAPQGAGRILPVNINPGDPKTRVEFGAMRFPDTSYLFWHYLKLALGLKDTDEFKEFPNPGKVPTYLVGDKSLSPYWVTGGIEELYNGDVNYAKLQSRHIMAFLNVSVDDLDLTLLDVSKIMLEGTSDSDDFEKVEIFWKELSKTYYNMSYEDFLGENGFSSDDIRVIGYLGLGTGGFEPLFKTSVLDVMRLIVWNYAAEYAVPNLYRFPFELKRKLSTSIAQHGGGLHYKTPIKTVGYSLEAKKYYLQTTTGISDYDYVVFAMTHKAAYNLFENAPLQIPEGMPEDTVFPYARFRSNKEIASLFRNDIQYQQGMSSVKIFQTMSGPSNLTHSEPFSSIDTSSIANAPAYNSNLRVVFGQQTQIGNHAYPVGVTYILPYGSEPAITGDLALGLQYSWGGDSVKLRDSLLKDDDGVDKQLKEGGTATGRPINILSSLLYPLYDSLMARVDSKEETDHVKNGKTHPLAFLPNRPPHTPADFPKAEGYYAIVDWDSVPHVNMGFKLDAPGQGMRSIYHFKTLATVEGTDNLHQTGHWDNNTQLDSSVKGLYFCGDSFSHFGGWVEGAFQSSLNATAGIVYAAADASGRLGDLSKYAIHLISMARGATPASTRAQELVTD